MQFTADTLKQVLQTIESKLKFSVEDINAPQGFDIICSISAEDIINTISTKQAEEIRYCLAVLERIDYINISSGVINGITPRGYKCICEVLHGVNFRY